MYVNVLPHLLIIALLACASAPLAAEKPSVSLELRGEMSSQACESPEYFDSKYPVLRLADSIQVPGIGNASLVEIILNEQEFIRFAEYDGRRVIVVCESISVSHLCGPDAPPRPACGALNVRGLEGET
jgi:hypothetical protein